MYQNMWHKEAESASTADRGGAGELMRRNTPIPGSFLSFLAKIQSHEQSTIMEVNMFTERFKRTAEQTTVKYKEFATFYTIIEQLKNKMHSPGKVKAKWLVHSGTIITPLKFSKENPSFTEFISQLVGVELEASEWQPMLKGVSRLFNKTHKDTLYWTDFMVFFSSRRWMRQARAEVQWWFPRDSLLDHSLVHAKTGKIAYQTVQQVAELTIDDQLRAIKNSDLKNQHNGSLILLMQFFQENGGLETWNLELLMRFYEKAIKAFPVREKTAKHTLKMMLFFEELTEMQRRRCLKIATRHFRSRKDDGSNAASGDTGSGKAARPVYEDFVVLQVFMQALLWQSQQHAKGKCDVCFPRGGHRSQSASSGGDASGLEEKSSTTADGDGGSDDQSESETVDHDRRQLQIKFICHWEARRKKWWRKSPEGRALARRLNTPREQATRSRKSAQEDPHLMQHRSRGREGARAVSLLDMKHFKEGAVHFDEAETVYNKDSKIFTTDTIMANYLKEYAKEEKVTQEHLPEGDKVEPYQAVEEEERDAMFSDLLPRLRKLRNLPSGEQLIKDVQLALCGLHTFSDLSSTVAANDEKEEEARRRKFIVHRPKKQGDEKTQAAGFMWWRIQYTQVHRFHGYRLKMDPPTGTQYDVLRDCILDITSRFKILQTKEADQSLTVDGRQLSLISPSDFQSSILCVLDVSRAVAVKYYRMLLPAISFKSQDRLPFRTIGWGQLHVPTSSPLYRLGTPIRVDSFKYEISSKMQCQKLIDQMDSMCDDFVGNLYKKAVHAEDVKIENDIFKLSDVLSVHQAEGNASADGSTRTMAERLSGGKGNRKGCCDCQLQ